jgi:hypothetical protein
MNKTYLKYFCKNCGTEVTVSDKSDEHSGWPHHCPLCLDDMKLIPSFETVAQWEARTGDKLGDDAWVWWRHIPDEYRNNNWQVMRLGEFVNPNAKIWQILVADGAYEPPDDYVPENYDLRW